MFTGKIKTVKVIDSLSSGNIINLILQNTPSVAENYEEIIKKDSDFEDAVSLWWAETKGEYPKNDSKFVVLAKVNIFSWINKILFANLIKSSFKSAYKIDEIDKTKTPDKALGIIENISQKCDFWNIFKKKLGEEYISPTAWLDIIEYNNFLVDANIEQH